MSYIGKFIAGAILALSASSFAAAADRWMEIPDPPAMPRLRRLRASAKTTPWPLRLSIKPQARPLQ